MTARLPATTEPAATQARQIVPVLRDIALRALARMYRPEQRLFAFRLRRTRSGKHVLEGVSHRYTAIALIGLATEPTNVAAGILAGESPHDVCSRLLDSVNRFRDLGEVALTLWAARALEHPGAPRALDRLRAMDPANGQHPTVEVAWSLTALAIPGSDVTDEALARSIAQRLLGSFNERSSLFPHWPEGTKGPFLRRHVTCFADLVYPVQALSYYHAATCDADALAAASRCTEAMCALQGPAGQWWWHYDVRTARVVERYPVYSVHQDSMVPMALLALEVADGPDHAEAIARSLAWLADPPEIVGSLIDRGADVIWRKVARREAFKLSRAAQALTSRLHPALRTPALGLVFRPRSIDYESRPYHMGWILHAWAGREGQEGTFRGHGPAV